MMKTLVYIPVYLHFLHVGGDGFDLAFGHELGQGFNCGVFFGEGRVGTHMDFVICMWAQWFEWSISTGMYFEDGVMQ